MACVLALSAELAGDGSAGDGAALRVVRFFGAEQGQEEQPAPYGEQLVKLPGRHQLLGWTLSRRTLEFLVASGADLDVDEYG